MEDQDIIQLFWDRNQEAIGESEKKYGRYRHAISMRIVRSLEDAQECVNDTWLHAWEAMPPTWPGRLSVWLGRVTRNLSLNRLEKQQAQKRGGGESVLIFDELENLISNRCSALSAGAYATRATTTSLAPDEAAITRELAAEISSWLWTLPDQKRHVFIGRYYYFTDLDTLVKQTGLPKNNLSVMLHRIRQDLRRYLRKRGYDV